MGNVVLNGGTSGQITLQPAAVAGTNTITLPAATGTVLTTAGGQSVGSSIGINGSTSGTVTLTVPAVAGTRTVTIAAQSGTIYATPPTVRAGSAGTQTVTSGVNTKITLTQEDWDTNTDFASSIFTPTIAGYYQINAMVRAGTSSTFSGNTSIYIFKNGSSWLAKVENSQSTTAYASISDIVYMNGTSDYIELYGGFNSAGTITMQAATFLSACLLRGA